MTHAPLMEKLTKYSTEIQTLRAQLAIAREYLKAMRIPDNVCSRSCACLDRTIEHVNRCLAQIDLKPEVVVEVNCSKPADEADTWWADEAAPINHTHKGTLVVWPKE